MKITIPDDIFRLVEKHKTHGDFVEISKRITKNDKDPDGNKSKAGEVVRAMRTGFGEVDIVQGIADYYKEKEQIFNQIRLAS